MIVKDGEGATKFVEIQVTGTNSDKDAHQIANTIAISPLVKQPLRAAMQLGALGDGRRPSRCSF